MTERGTRAKAMERLLSQMAFVTAAGMAVLILVTLAAAFASGSLYLWLISKGLEASAAALLVSTAIIGVAGLIALVVFLVRRHRASYAKLSQPSAASFAKIAGELGELAASETISLIQAHPYRAFLISLAAGFVVGASPELRQILMNVKK